MPEILDNTDPLAIAVVDALRQGDLPRVPGRRRRWPRRTGRTAADPAS